MTLTEFLLERIAEDSEDAHCANEVRLLRWSQDNNMIINDAGFMQRFTRSRMIAECEAKRLIVEQHVEHESRVAAYRSPRWVDGMNDNDILNWRKAEAVCAATDSVVRALALPYANHPDYREEWRP